MAPLPVESANGLNDHPQPFQHRRAKSASETQREEARVVFNRTIEGHYRHGKTGYRRVGALFLTWADDDMHCKTKEVATLEGLFREEFHFLTELYEIPSERWATALHKKLADFCYEYDHPEDLAIIYYAGHAYEGEETKKFKFAAKLQNDGHGDPTAFFNDVRSCVQLPSCDQLMILDCCYAARAFTREHIGKRKFELLTSSADDIRSPAPHLPNSFTRALCQALKALIKENPKGFCTSHLYREVYHTMPVSPISGKPNPKPLLFDQARHSLGRIWLRPQAVTDLPPKTTSEASYLKLTFRLNEKPDLAVMNELASQLQYLPHVDQVRVDDLYAPEEQITDFMRLVLLARKLRPFVQRLHAKRRWRKAKALSGSADEVTPTSLMKLQLGQNRLSTSNPIWSNASRDNEHISNDNERSGNHGKRLGTWPPAQKKPSMNGSESNGYVTTRDKVDVPSEEGPVIKFKPPQVGTITHLLEEQQQFTHDSRSADALGTSTSNKTYEGANDRNCKRQRSPSPRREPALNKAQKVCL